MQRIVNVLAITSFAVWTAQVKTDFTAHLVANKTPT